jgi:hypothetical protein
MTLHHTSHITQRLSILTTLSVFVLLFFTQCKKDESSKESTTFTNIPNSNAKNLYSPTVSPNNSAIIAKIESFQNKIIELRNNKGLSTRSGDNMKVDDFLWNMEALLNFKYGEPNKPFGNIVEKNDIVEIPLNSDGKVNTSDLVKAVESIRNKVGEQWELVNSSLKHVVAINLSLEKSNSQNLATSVRFRIGTGIGIGPVGGGPTPSDYGPFNEGESYYFGFGLKCNQTIGKDAAQRLSEEINMRFPSYAKYNGFFVSINDDYDLSAYSYILKEDSGRNNDRDAKLFLISAQFQNFNIAKTCINASDMNFYYNNLYEIMKQKKQSTNYANLDFAYVALRGNAHLHTEPTTGENHETYFHDGSSTFGVFALANCQRVCEPSFCVEPNIGGGCFYTPCGF